MKHLNTVISDETDRNLVQIMIEKRLKNRADAVEWLITEAFNRIKQGGEEKA